MPEAILVDQSTITPLAVIEVKSHIDLLADAIREATAYGSAFVLNGFTPLAIALAGTSEDRFSLQALKWNGTKWVTITYDQSPISWIPNRADVDRLRLTNAVSELRPSIPPPDVLADKADEINRLLREASIKDEFRPGVVGAIMLAIWQSKGVLRKDPQNILADINSACSRAFWTAKKPYLAQSLRVDEANDILAAKAPRIVSILERLGVSVLTAEHDYLGQLYETFFRYTGGNTIGQYFTPRHIADLMADLCQIDQNDIVLDPACGTGGFLVAAMNRVLKFSKLSRTEVVKLVKTNLIGFDKEPVTAALCVANMILRGDGSTGIRHHDALSDPKYPIGKASVVLMNPPFPHKKTDVPPERFVARGLVGLRDKGLLAALIPRSMMAKRDKRSWRDEITSSNTLLAVIVLPDELFEPYASSYTVTILLKKGVPHKQNSKVFFARIENDGLKIKKGVRAPRPGEQMTEVLAAFSNQETIPGLCGWKELDHEAGWDAGFYIPPKRLSAAELAETVSALVRGRTASAVMHAPQLVEMMKLLALGDLKTTSPYLHKKPVSTVIPGTIGAYFEIRYGQKALHSKERLAPGSSLVISSSGLDNGFYGFFEFQDLLTPPFVTVPSTGSLAMANVQEWACGVTDDCLLLLPKPGTTIEMLYIAAAVVRNEKWRFNYGMKVTPRRIFDLPLPIDDELIKRVASELVAARDIQDLAFESVKGSGVLTRNELSSKFQDLTARWKRSTLHFSSVRKITSHPAYLEIIDLGPEVVPMILREMQNQPDHWLVALNALTGEDPAQIGMSFSEAVASWVDWGRKKGLVE